MIDNIMWTQTNIKNESLIIKNAIDQYFNSLEMFHRFLDWSDFDKEDLKITLSEINQIITEEVSKRLKDRNIDFNLICSSKLGKIKLSELDYFKLYICSCEVYHFWNMPFNGLIFFYLDNLKKNKEMNIDIYIGRIQYLFDMDNDEQFEIFEKFIIQYSKINT
jgi:hypothetical protein